MEKNQAQLINQLLKENRIEHLISERLYMKGFNEVKAILEMPEWEDEKFKGLLTSTIWNSNATDVKNKLYLPYWNDSKYQHLLTPSIFGISIKNIESGITLLEKYGISQYITNRCLRRNQKEQESLIKYMIEKGIELVIDEKNGIDKKLNPLLNASSTELRKKYNIDIKKINNKYRTDQSEGR